MTVSVEDYNITEDAKEGLDVSVDINLKQWRSYGTKTAKVEQPSTDTGKQTVTVEKERDASTAPSAKTYTVKKGDTLWAISAKYYGAGAQYTKIYGANTDKISNPNLIYRKLAVNGRYIRGFGVPKYASKATSAPSGGGEAPTPGKDEKPTPGLAVGSVVTFTGTKHYISSMAVNGKSCKPGEAKVTAVAKSGKHPYHLIKTTGSSSTVYGWVDAADVKEVLPAIVKGSRVKVAKGAKTYNGGSLASYVYTTTYTVIQIDGSRVVIGINGVVTAAVNIKDLTLVG